MSDHTPISEAVIEHPEHIPGYTYGTEAAVTSPLSLQDLERLKEAVWLTPEDERALREAAEILADQADDLVTAWRARRELRHRGGLRRHPMTPSPSIPQDQLDDLQHDLRQFHPQAGPLSRRR